MTTSRTPAPISCAAVPQRDRPAVVEYAQLAQRRAQLARTVAALGGADLSALRRAEQPLADCVARLAQLRSRATGHAARVMDEVASRLGLD